MPDLHYESTRLAELYDLDSPWSIDRDFYLSLAGSPPSRVLDLGCGTGLLSNAYAKRGHDVTGVDPSGAMLDVARKKSHGGEIEWVQSSAQSYDSQKRFDLIVMTGHAFQVLLEDDDVAAALSTMRRHLNEGGLVAFESRNPSMDWSAKWNYNMVLESSQGTVYESRSFLSMANERMTFQLRYQFSDETLISESKLRFMSRKQIEQLLLDCGLVVNSLYGNWASGDFNEKTSPEMIFLARAKPE